MPVREGVSHFTGLNVGDAVEGTAGTDIKLIKSGTVAVDPASIAAGASAETAVTITGVAAGDIVILEPPASLESGLVADGVGRVSAADTVQVRLTNASAAAIDGASLTWRYLHIDLT